MGAQHSREGEAIPVWWKREGAFHRSRAAGKTLGVIGLVRRSKVANAAVSLGMKVYGYDPASRGRGLDALQQVIHATDIETCTMRATMSPSMCLIRGTPHMIDAEAIAKMKDGVRIINLARAELVNDDDLIAAIDAAKVSRYVTDFPNGKTAKIPNVLPIPHLGASTPESEEKCAVMAAKEIYDYLVNGNVKNSVNFPNAGMARKGKSRFCIFHRNVPRMLNACLELIGKENINVENLLNTARGEYAYSMIDRQPRCAELGGPHRSRRRRHSVRLI
jgi:D-3-phosphoglycerate dehydrogenase